MRPLSKRAGIIAIALCASVSLWLLFDVGSRGSDAGAGSSPRTTPVAKETARAANLAVSDGEPEVRESVSGVAELDARTGAGGGSYTGRVIDSETRLGIQDAQVGSRLALNTAMLRELEGQPLPRDVTRTDAEGRFRLPRSVNENLTLLAVHPDYAAGSALLLAEASELTIKLTRGPHVFGMARTDTGEPAADVFVRVYGPDWPRAVSAFTNARGEYKTGAVHPGPIEVVATPTFGKSETDVGFTSEWKQAEIGDTDLRVDFGVSGAHVTWQGRVLDELEEVIPNGRLELTPHETEISGLRFTEMRGLATEFDGGSFTVRKLVPGMAYEVRGRFEEGSASILLGEVLFEEPGRFERDLHLANSSIHGIVVDGATGEPPAEGGNVYVTARGLPGSGVRAGLDDAGQFRVRGLKPALYDIYVHAPGGYSSVQLEGVRIGGDGLPRPVRIEVHRGGELTVELRDFDPGIVLDLEFDAEGAVRYVPKSSTDSSGAFSATWTLPAGTWTVRMRSVGRGTAEQVVPLAAGGSGNALFLPGDLLRFEDRVSVEGTLRTTGGDPVEGANLTFYGGQVDLAEDEDRLLQAVSDAEGSFRAEGFAVGRWTVRVTLGGGSQVDFPDLVIAPEPVDPVPLHLVLPEGRVHGQLADEASGALLAADEPRWWAFLREVESERLVAELQGGHTGSAFELGGIAPGRFRLMVSAQGYFEYQTEPFDVGDGEVVDVGRLELAPCAVLAVDVRNADGGPHQSFSVHLDDRELPGWSTYGREPGYARWDGFGDGTFVVAVTAEGFERQEHSVQLVAGKVTTQRFELVPH